MHVQEYHAIFDQFEHIIRNSFPEADSPGDTQRKKLLLDKMNDFMTVLIDQKQSKFFYYWYNGRFFVDFLLRQRDLGVITLTLQVLFKLLKNRSKNPETIRIFFDDLFEPFFGFLFAINNGPLLGQFQTLNSDFLQDPRMEAGGRGS